MLLKERSEHVCIRGKGGSPVMVFEQRMEKHRKSIGVHSALDLGVSPDPPLTNWLMTVKFLDSSVPQFSYL